MGSSLLLGYILREYESCSEPALAQSKKDEIILA